ncbi:MAG: thiamine-phosphate kinase [Flavobacteriales bacterium]|nr:thiamine-phosphate kinase [Flavobacteriales bacterium]
MLGNSDKTSLEQIGEFGLIALIKDSVKLYNKQTVMGIGDDAAVMNPAEKQVVITTDMLVEGVHFDMSYVPLKHLGYKAVAANLSDVYAMNATPIQITCSIAVSSRYTVEAIEALYEGINHACKAYNVDLVGGDTTSSLSGMVIGITAIGLANATDLVYRQGAKKGDLICVTGNLGAAYAGLQILKREKSIYIENPGVQPDLDGYDYVLERQLKPEPRADIITQLRELELKPTSMMDVSDGLASELHHICKASACGCRIDAEKIPIDTHTWQVAEELNIQAMTMALYGGEDYELLLTVKQDDYEKARMIADLHVIGYITEEKDGQMIIDSQNHLHPIAPAGWDAFQS